MHDQILIKHCRELRKRRKKHKSRFIILRKFKIWYWYSRGINRCAILTFFFSSGHRILLWIALFLWDCSLIKPWMQPAILKMVLNPSRFLRSRVSVGFHYRLSQTPQDLTKGQSLNRRLPDCRQAQSTCPSRHFLYAIAETTETLQSTLWAIDDNEFGFEQNRTQQSVDYETNEIEQHQSWTL